MRGVAVVAVSLLVLAGCGGAPASTSPPATLPPSPTVSVSSPPPPTSAPPTSTSPAPPASASPTPALGTVPPPWLGTRPLPVTADGFGEIQPTPPELRERRFTLPDTLPALPGDGFASRVTTPAPADVLARSTWAPGCPVAAKDLSWVRLTFRGFDGARHTGELLVNRSAAAGLVRVFHDLYDARFPIEEMRITPKAEQKVPPTGDGNDTGAFNCRPVRGATTYSQHAYGLAVDVDPFQNPYLKGDLVLPELASAYRDRSWHRPGMILAGGPVVRAFARIGWGWGGSWHSLKDLQHFSANGT
ncbi:MAG: M15 family metallopeptidase [Propionibacteriales bacterium]|nr:M15 family metallopeptidase [Propionibacteriales bacterium]